MKKTIKKFIAILGICAVLISAMSTAVLANDVTTPSSNIQQIEDFYDITTINFYGNNRNYTFGSPFTVFQNKNSGREEWNSRDRISAYFGSGQYFNIEMIHTGYLREFWNYPGTGDYDYSNYYLVVTQFPDVGFEANHGIEIKYDTFLYDLINTATEGEAVSEAWMINALVPYTRVFSEEQTITVKYTYNEFIETETETGISYRETPRETIVTYPMTGAYACIPNVPIYMKDGVEYYGTLPFDEVIRDDLSWMITDVTCRYIPYNDGTEDRTDFEFEMVNFFQAEEGQPYSTTYGLWAVEHERVRYEYPEIDTGGFLSASISNILNLQIYPGVSLIAILGVAIAIPLLLAFLKFFAGG